MDEAKEVSIDDYENPEWALHHMATATEAQLEAFMAAHQVVPRLDAVVSAAVVGMKWKRKAAKKTS